jgi:hypothetical protein
VKILSVEANNRRKAFEIRTREGEYVFPYVSPWDKCPRSYALWEGTSTWSFGRRPEGDRRKAVEGSSSDLSVLFQPSPTLAANPTKVPQGARTKISSIP